VGGLCGSVPGGTRGCSHGMAHYQCFLSFLGSFFYNFSCAGLGNCAGTLRLFLDGVNDNDNEVGSTFEFFLGPPALANLRNGCAPSMPLRCMHLHSVGFCIVRQQVLFSRCTLCLFMAIFLSLISSSIKQNSNVDQTVVALSLLAFKVDQNILWFDVSRLPMSTRTSFGLTRSAFPLYLLTYIND
jgi:hypothetical protein